MAQNYDRDTKVRVIAVYQAIMRGRPITAGEIQRELQDKFGIGCNRKTIYSDIAAIDRFVSIRAATGRGGGYSLWDVVVGGKRRWQTKRARVRPVGESRTRGIVKTSYARTGRRGS